MESLSELHTVENNRKSISLPFLIFFLPSSSSSSYVPFLPLHTNNLIARHLGLMGFLFLHVVVLMYFGSAFPHVAGSMQSGNETDRLALLAFKFAITSDSFGALNSWNASNHFCQWVGVTCGRRHERVTVLNLNHGKLTGPISPHIGNLSFLRELWLRNNSLSHKIPPELGRLRRLQIMTMRNNSLTGEIPTNISACSELQRLDFFGNKLAGKFPVELGFLSKLIGLYFERNNLEGSIPSTFGNLSSLKEFFAHANNLSGTIPDDLGGLTKLDKLSLGFNMLVGTIPSSILNLSSLTWFHLPGNQIQGSLPSDLGFTLPNLQVLEVGGNLFAGSVPMSVSNATKLNYLGISYNELNGNVPNLGKLHDLLEFVLANNRLGTGEVDDLSFLDSLSNATNLYKLDLGYNHFGGVLPESISNLSANLVGLIMDSNKIAGNIPTGIGNLISLQLLQLSNNHFTGNLPTDFGKLQKLQYLFLSGNKLYGDIPSSLGNLTLLSELHLDDNRFDGSIPSSLGKCPLLVVLKLGGNNLTGAIPPEVISVSSLLNLNLSYNHLTGSLQPEIGHLINLEHLDVSENMLSGKIPSTIGSCVKLTLLHIGGNKFWGVIPSSLSSLRGMEDLDLSCNYFSGKIPDYFEDFVFLQKLNLSFNNFEGAVPQIGKFRNATIVLVKGNNRLCGGIPELQLHSCDSKGSRKIQLALILKIVIPASFGLLGLAVILSLLSNKWPRKTTKKTSLSFLGSSFTKISYQSLLKATDGFSPTNLIGVGSFGSVYKGILDQGGKVAVKVLNLQFHCASKSFIAECRALKSIRHRNLVKLITVCSSIDYHGNDFKALVYELMVNGSLEEWLHPNENKDEPHEESRNLNLLLRLNIAIDVASALDYLHHHCLDTIIHCDLKPSNILLDGGMVAHVGDFGLARFLVQATSNSSANQSSSIGIRGSVGYAAPEYGMGNEASTSGDVYSYGILLLEMFTGMRPTHSMFNDSLTLHNFAKSALPEQIVSIADPTLFQHRETGMTSSSIESTQNDSSSGGPKIQGCLISILKVGIACSEELPAHRPEINDVVSQLHAIRNSMIESGVHGGEES